MTREKKRFLAALALYAVWVGLVAVLVVTSSEPPRARGAASSVEQP